MRERGFSLVELITVIAIIGILASMATLYFNQMQRKSMIEKQVTLMYSTLMSVRLQAMYMKTPRAVTLSGSQMKIFASQDTSLAPQQTIAMSYPVSGANTVNFDAAGLMLDNELSICVDPTGTLADNPGFTDSVDVGMAKIFVGKRQSGAACVPANIVQK